MFQGGGMSSSCLKLPDLRKRFIFMVQIKEIIAIKRYSQLLKDGVLQRSEVHYNSFDSYVGEIAPGYTLIIGLTHRQTLLLSTENRSFSITVYLIWVPGI